MNNQLSDIDAILDHLYAHDEAIPPQGENQPHRTINVYIDVEEEDSQALPPTVEGTLDTDRNRTVPLPDEQITPPSPGPTTEPHTATSSVQPTHHPSMHPRLIVLVVTLVAVLATLIGLTIRVALSPLLAPSTTITLVTTSQHLTTTSTLQLVTTGTADPTKQQVPGRALPTITMSQQKTIATTGTAHQDATAGHGIITFYNSATSTQMIPAGTVLIGADGVQLVTDADATIPTAVFPTFGQASIAAHAAITGPGGNVRAGDVYGACCRLNVSAVNGAFHGGQDARTYQTVTPQDIQGAATSATTSLEQSVQAALQTQVQARETLITPLNCTQKVTPDHQPGEEAAQVSITIDETCTGTVYSTQAWTSITAQIATQDATKRLGTGYTTTGIQTSIIKATPTTHGMIDLQIKSMSIWTYQYGPEQEQSIKAMIAGMRKDKATATLLHLAGVQSVSITTTNGTTVPTDARNIHLLFVQL